MQNNEPKTIADSRHKLFLSDKKVTMRVTRLVCTLYRVSYKLKSEIDYNDNTFSRLFDFTNVGNFLTEVGYFANTQMTSLHA